MSIIHGIPDGIIESVIFSPRNTSDNRINSNCIINNSKSSKDNIPINNGPNDTRLGTTENNIICNTCYNNVRNCPGHFGNVDLNIPVKNPLFKDEIRQWLKIICFNCGSLIIDKKSHISHIEPRHRLREYVRLTRTEKNLNCHKCNETHPNIIKDPSSPVDIVAEYYANNILTTSEVLYNHTISNIFDRVSSETLKILSIHPRSHPRNFILDSIPISPSTSRPDIRRNAWNTRNNDFTTFYKYIIDFNNKLPLIRPDIIPEDKKMYCKLLDLIYNSMIKGTTMTGKYSIVTNANVSLNSYSSTLVGKPGRIRANLNGKRAWYISRGVISCDPHQKFNEIGIPQKMARSMQVKETVTHYNKKYLDIFFYNGTETYPGCTRITKKNGNTFIRESINDSFVLEVGDILYRDIIDGDVALLNRQPTLVTEAISAVKLIVIKDSNTIRLNISQCVLFGADFDGDAMVLIFNNDIMSRFESYNIASISNRMISYKNGTPWIGMVQDNLIGISKATKDDNKMSKLTSMYLTRQFNNIIDYNDRETYKSLISKFLPDDLNYSKKTSYYKKEYEPYINYSSNDKRLEILNGTIINGVIDKGVIGEGVSGSIIHVVYNKYGPKVSELLINTLQTFSINCLSKQGYTLNFDDLEISSSSKQKITKLRDNIIMDSKKTHDDLINGKIIPPIGYTEEKYYHILLTQRTSITDEFIIPMLEQKNIGDNSLYNMSSHCGVGKIDNFKSIRSSMGMPTIDGDLFPDTYGDGRTMPYYKRCELSIESFGMSKNSLLEGYKTSSYIASCADARANNINKVLSTSVPGTISRQLIKMSEDVIVDNLRNCVSGKNVYSLLYGGDGFDVRSFEKDIIPTIYLNEKELKKKYKFNHKNVIFDEEYKQISDDRIRYVELYITLEYINNTKLTNNIKTPVNVKRIILDTHHRYIDEDIKQFDPISTLKKINIFLEELSYIYSNNIQKNQKSKIPEHYKRCLFIYKIYIRSHLNIRNLNNYKISNEGINIILESIWNKLKKSLISYGTSSGIIATQALMEPITQYIISSHHRSGISGLGGEDVSFLKKFSELQEAKPTNKLTGPEMIIFPSDEYIFDKKQVELIASEIECLYIRDITNNTKIFYEDIKNPIHPDYKHEKKIIETFYKINKTPIPKNITKFVIRLEFNKIHMIKKKIELRNISEAIKDKYMQIHIVMSNENDNQINPFIRLYIPSSLLKNNKKNNIKEYVKDLSVSIINTKIRGIDNITSCGVVKKQRKKIDKDGNIIDKIIYVIITKGTNLLEILKHKKINQYNTDTSSVMEIQQVYGISAAKAKYNSLLLKLCGSDICYSHYHTITNVVSHMGRIIPMNRTGLGIRSPNDTLHRASFEFLIMVLKNASLKNNKSIVKGISPNLILGQTPRIGTTYNSFSINEDIVKANKISVDDIIDIL